jgi:hypothetical protein
MKERILPIVVTLVIFGLVANTYRMHQKLKSVTTPVSADYQRLQELEQMKTKWDEREVDLLNENAQLIIKCNELQQELNQKPLTIIKYKRNEKNPINRSASENITNILSNRYSFQ